MVPVRAFSLSADSSASPLVLLLPLTGDGYRRHDVSQRQATHRPQPWETILTQANLKSNTFGLLFNGPVDGEIDAQPLYLSSVTISGERRAHGAVIDMPARAFYQLERNYPEICGAKVGGCCIN